MKTILEKDHGNEITTFPKALIINKMDLCTNKKKLNWLVSEIEDLSKFEAKFFISCETGYGIP
jgi:GTP-binding protein Era